MQSVIYRMHDIWFSSIKTKIKNGHNKKNPRFEHIDCHYLIYQEVLNFQRRQRESFD